MGISRNLTGTPWHIEKMVREEGDPRRHRARCCYFRKKDSYCISRKRKCIGSAHCSRYNEQKEEQEEQNITCVNKTIIRKPTETDYIEKAKEILPVGSLVQHNRFGDGKVIRYEGENIIIDFKDVGNKTMSVKSSIKKLKKIDKFTLRQSLARDK